MQKTNYLMKMVILKTSKKICDFMFIQVGNLFLMLLLVTCNFLFSSIADSFSISRDLAMFLKKIMIMFGPMNIWSIIYIVVGFWTFVDQIFVDALVG